MEIQSQGQSISITWKVLIIDDDEDDYLISKEMLSEARGRHFETQWASSYEVGKRRIAEEHFDAVLVDYDLGLRTGIELIREINERGFSTPLILFTGRGNYEVDVEAMQAGATMYLTKHEVNPLLLERYIRYAVEIKQKEQALRKNSISLQHSERMVRDMARRLKTILENSLDVAYQTNLKTMQYEYISPVVEEVTGLTVDELMQMGPTGTMTQIHPDDLPKVVSAEWRSEEMGFEKITYRMKIKDGTYRWFEENFRVARNEDGELWVRTGILRDVHERMLLQEENQRQKERLEQLVQFAPAAIAFLKGPQHVYELANEQYRQIARGKGELIGRPVSEVWPEVAGMVIPQLDMVYQTGQPFSARDNPLIIVRDGRPEENFFTYTFTPIYDTDHHVEGIMVLAIETTTAVFDQQAVESQSARLEAVLQALPVGVWVADEVGRILKKNEQADRIWAGDAPMLQDLKDYGQYQAWNTQTGKKLRAEDYPMSQALSSGQPVEPVELRIRRFDGSTGYVLASARPILQKNGRLKGAVAINLDITRRKQMEQSLDAAYTRLRLFVDSNIIGVALSNEDGTMVEANDYYLNLLGYSREDFERGMVNWREVTPPEYISLDEAALEELKAHGASKPFEKEYHRKDGSRAWAYISVAISPEGRIAAFVLDITARKQMEEKLREDESRFRAALSSALITVYTTDRDLRVSWIHDPNPGFDPALYLGLRLDEMLPGEIGMELVRNQEQVIKTGQPMRGDIEAMIHGSLMAYSYFLDPIRNLSGEVVGLACAGYDVTEIKRTANELKRYARELEQSNQALQDFAFVASHDLQEPLRKIKMLGGLLKNRAAGALDRDSLANLDRMIQASTRMQAMINALLDLSRVNTQGGAFERVNLTQIVEGVVYDLEGQIHKSAGRVIVDSLPEIDADPIQMRQLFQNLIGNALKFHRRGVPPVVKVSASTQNSRGGRKKMVSIEVEDNGIGFPEHEFERILQPFQRLHGRAEYEGTGIGLAIVKKIVERHHGQITARSQPGQGTTLVITLPLRQSS